MPAKKKAAAIPRTGFASTDQHIPEGVKVLWRPHPGPQERALLAPEDEILYGGSKGGGKTACGIIWLLKGNPQDLRASQLRGDPPDPVDISYINHKHYRALVLRQNQNDLTDWIDKADRIYSQMGAEFRERPVMYFEFPTGARIVLGHLADSDAYTKYTGQEFQRFLLEEATLIPDLKSYEMVRSCIRSTYPKLKSQILLTANPGNKGHAWVRDRFVKVKAADGTFIKANTAIVEEFNIRGKIVRQTRVYIPARLTDNPSLMADPTYESKLLSLPAPERRALLDGDWDALSGNFFTDFRERHLSSEPAEAQHVIPSTPLEPWLPRAIGFDWGYGHDGAAFWGCDNIDGRFHVYRELVQRQRGAEQWGVDIALASIADLRGLEEHVMVLYMSHDAWDKRNDTRTVADQFSDGIRKVLGPNSCIVLTADEEQDSVMSRLREQRGMGIMVRKASNQRIAGAQYIASKLRWEPLTKNAVQQFDQEFFVNLLRADTQRAMEYREACMRKQEDEVLPGLLIHDCCKRLIAAIPALQRDEANPNDVLKVPGSEHDDCYDGFRYLVFSHSRGNNRLPKKIFVDRRIDQVVAAHGGHLDGQTRVWVARKAEADFEGDAMQFTEPIFISRMSSRRAAVQ